MVNSEALGAASLLPGSYPQRLGRRLGGEVELTTRDGNRSGVHGRAGLSGTSANAIVEGPFAGGKGGWIASVRRSYLDFLLDRIDPEGSFGFGFSDALGKVTFDVNPRHHVQLLTIAGRSTFDEAPEDISVNDEAVARSRAWLAAATWRFTPGPRLVMTQRLYATGMRFRNVNEHGTLLDGGEARDVAWRADVTLAPTPRWIVDVGGDVVRTPAANTRQRTLDGAANPRSRPTTQRPDVPRRRTRGSQRGWDGCAWRREHDSTTGSRRKPPPHRRGSRATSRSDTAFLYAAALVSTASSRR